MKKDDNISQTVFTFWDYNDVFRKKKYFQDIMENAKLDYRAYKTRDMYKRINHSSREYKKKDGTLITSSKEIVNR